MVTTQLRTAQDLWEIGDDGRNLILIAGEFFEVAPPNGAHGRMTSNLALLLGNFVVQNALGQTYIGDTGFLLERNPETVLAPDLSFIARERIPENDDAYLEVPPDIAIEVVSASNRAGEIERRVAIYLAAGVRQVWIVYPTRRQVAIYKPEDDLQVFTDAQVINCSPELHGLVVPVAQIFDGPNPANRRALP